MDPKEISVIGLGQACLDFLGRIDVFPAEDEKVELLDLQSQCGGPASTALVTLARLGVKTSFLGSISDDFFGKKIVEGLCQEGVDSSFLKVTPGFISQMAFIAVGKDQGKRTIFWHRGTAPPLIPEDVDLSPFSSARVLHIDGLMIHGALRAVRQAKKMGLLVVMDAGTMRKGSLDLASSVDVLIASEGFAEALGGPESTARERLEALSRLGPGVVVITLGSQGSLGWEAGKIIHQKAFPVQVVDTTGAGDVYHGGFIYGMLQEWDMALSMRFASAVSALKCRKIGARRAIPALAETMKFISDFPEL